ncbi:MAG: ribonuclease Y [Oscillospiraceae bacterium]|nr:ribonuclease Y [Oscillospiraceae bacterium]
MQQTIIMAVLSFGSFVLGSVVLGIIMFKRGVKSRMEFAETHIGSAEKEAQRIISEAEEKALAEKKNALVEAKDEIYKLKETSEKERNRLKSETDRELKERRAEVTRAEKRLQQKEENLDKKGEKFEKMEETLLAKHKKADEHLQEAEDQKQIQIEVLQRISGFSDQEAKAHILEILDSKLDHEKAVKIKAYEQRLKDECDTKARSHIALAISRLASETTSELTISVVPLPTDELKGRIIGREGRNIRTLEQLTGVDLIVDDTPEAITLSSHDKVRREIARISLERLIQDGRIHPTRIEEMVERARRDVEAKIKDEGERAVMEAHINMLNPELTKLLGRLYYRTSYGQNVLAHSLEVAHIAGMLASELGIDATSARRAGLLHDIGKALTHEIEGSHVNIGVDVLRRYKEKPEIIHAVEAHHGDVEPRTILAALVQAADAISAARPGARSESYENYIKRLQKLEEICASHQGVERAFAIQAGREIRVMIKPEAINDDGMVVLARKIAENIEKDMEYPGQIRVHLIRESRAVDFAK